MNILSLDLAELEYVGTEGGGYSGTQYRYRCPACRDGYEQAKLHVDMELRWAKCWCCGLSVPLKAGNPLEPLTIRNIERFVRSMEHLAEIDYPHLPHNRKLSTKGLAYLTGRLGSEPAAVHAAHKYAIRETAQAGKRWNNRLLVPIFGGGQLESFVARAMDDHTEPKVLNGPKHGKHGCAFFATPNETTTMSLPKLDKLAIVEGVFDALQVGRLQPAIAILGSKLYDKQLSRLLEATSKQTQINILMDPDGAGLTGGFNCAPQLRAHDRKVRNLGGRLRELGKDPGGCTLRELQGVLR